MRNPHFGPAQGLPDIERTEISAELLENCKDEDDFNRISVSLGVELGSWAGVIANVDVKSGKPWDRSEAILGGLVVRLYKIISGVLDQTCQHRQEMTMILSRLAFETMVNLVYLIEKGSEEIYESYILYSLRHEIRLLELIEKNIRTRDGAVLPIEERMISSIEKTFYNSGFERGDATKISMTPWSKLNLYKRAEAIGWEHAYLGAFGGPSHSVHGNWQDLIQYQLQIVEGGYKPNFNWHHPRPHLVFLIVILGCKCLAAYASHVLDQHSEPFINALSDLCERARQANDAHENFLSNLA